MQTPAQRCARILGAFEDLVDQEAAALHSGDAAAASAIADRTAPLVDFLAQHASVLERADLLPRLVAVKARRDETAARLDAEIATIRSTLQETGAAQRRAAQIAPVYGAMDAKAKRARPQLRAVT